MPAELRQQAYKFALDPTPAQQRAFASHAGGARFAYNWGIATYAKALDAWVAEKAAGAKPTTKLPGHFDLCKQWTAHKDAHREKPDEEGRTLGWVADNHVGTYQAALRDAHGAWQKMWDSRSGKRAGRPMGRPRFKKKGRSRDSFQVHGDSLRLVDGSHVNLPKIGTVKIPGKVRVGTWIDRNARRARQLMRLLRKSAAAGLMGCPTCPGTGQVWVALKDGEQVERKCKSCRGRGKVEQARIVRATISRGASGTWWCSVTAELVRDLPAAPSRRQRTGGTVGVDLGVKHLAVTSTGVTYTNSRYLNGALAELKVAQRALSRAQKDSKRREKARCKVGTLHEQVALMRQDATDRITTELARGHDLIVVEGWDAQRLAERGSADAPKRLRKDRNRALADAAPGMIRWQLEYKTSWLGGRLVKTAPGDETGRTCSQCGQAKAKPVPLGEDTFRCGSCGYRGDRRANTARLLARHGREGLGAKPAPPEPRGGDVRPGTPRRDGRSSVMRDARARPDGHRSDGRGKAGSPDP